MEKRDFEQFTKDYINAWSTTDSVLRKQLIGKVYALNAGFFANEPGDAAVEHHGLKEIYLNITQVNERLVIGAGLLTILTGFSKNHEMLKITWEMKTPEHKIALKGMNLLLLDDSEKIGSDYIFIG